MPKVTFVYESEDLKPVKKHKTDQGWDLKQKEDITIGPKMWKVIPTGVYTQIPKGYYGQILPRSGLQSKNGIMVMGGVIDSEYRGEIQVILYNVGQSPFQIKRGDRICQFVIQKVLLGQEFKEKDKVTQKFFKTERGENGLGSSGI